MGELDDAFVRGEEIDVDALDDDRHRLLLQAIQALEGTAGAGASTSAENQPAA